ncbi:hypothetical protein [Marinifilum flexuosum]|uniref:Uncharacterized protein n=1 Tax=Marinifilum flexuosum TaxID=1117708 RepID=A0A419X9R3_9BACT|nr:hypothetical protein [Marinifilum flexuosum]RKE04455.1 hypothetical protein BXY64_1475 [Marinifilum flexuosum]
MELVKVLEEKANVRAIAKANKQITFDTDGAQIEKDVLYIRKSLAGKTGIQQLMKPQDVEKDGVRNIDSARLTGGVAFLVTGILISTANCAAKLASEDEISAQEFNVGSENPTLASFFNNELSIKVANKEKMKAILRHMTPEQAGDDKTVDMAHEVSPFIIAPNQTILPELNIFNAPCPADKDIVIEVAFVGYKITENHA